jgi:predicted Zn-dependent protease
LSSASNSPPRAETLLRAQAVEQAFHRGSVSTDLLRESAGRLQVWVAEHREDAAAWLVLARHHELLGSRLRALRSQAEAQALRGDLVAAIDLLRAAQSLSRRSAGADFIEASVVDARLRDLERQRRQLLAEMRSQRSPGNRREDPRGDPRGDPPEDVREDAKAPRFRPKTP